MPTWQGKPRKLLIQANRNGFFYVLDRVDGKFLFGTQYVKNVTWATGLTPEGRPLRVPDMEPSLEGRRVCPSLEGASNWYSTSFNPATGLYYVQTNDKCGVFTKVPTEWAAGQRIHGRLVHAGSRRARATSASRNRHPDRQSRWEIPRWSRHFVGRSPEHRWRHRDFRRRQRSADRGGCGERQAIVELQTNQNWKASPMTYMFDNKQYVAVAAGSSIIAFAVPD